MAKFGVDEMEELAGEAAKRLKEFFTKDYENESAWVPARIAQSTISAFAKLRQTESAREATRVLVARELTTGDPELFKEYIRVSIPDAPFVHLLEKPNGKPEKNEAPKRRTRRR